VLGVEGHLPRHPRAAGGADGGIGKLEPHGVDDDVSGWLEHLDVHLDGALEACGFEVGLEAQAVGRGNDVRREAIGIEVCGHRTKLSPGRLVATQRAERAASWRDGLGDVEVQSCER